MNGKLSALQGYQSWSLSGPLTGRLKPRIEAISGIPMGDANDFGVPPLWRVSHCSFKQATFAAQLWNEIHRLKDKSSAIIKSCAQHYETLSARHINRATATIKRYNKGDYKKEIVSLEPLLLADLEDLKSKLSLIGNGRMTGETSSQIAEGAALLYLSNCLSQMAIVAMVVRRECAWPMKKLPSKWYTSATNIPILASYCMKIAGSINTMNTVGNIVQRTVGPAVIHSDLLRQVSQRVAVGSVIHTINNRLHTSTGYLELIMEEIKSLLDGNVDGLDQFHSILNEWEDIPNALVHTAISDDEPIVHIGKQYGSVELIADGSVPKYIDVTNLNIIVGHFVNNSYTHPHPWRKLKVVMMQSAYGIYVMDNGSGISLDRLRIIEHCIRSGRIVLTDHENGTGSGLRDAIHLLDKLFVKDAPVDRDAMNRQAIITIASKEDVGTIASITWLKDTDEVEFDAIPDDWNYIQFPVDLEEETTARRADSGGLPRPVSDIIAAHDAFIM